MANIWDVAEKAGVSKTTVSRVINNAENVKEETRIIVEKAMKDLNFTPSFFGRGIRTGRTKTIALLVPDYSNVFYNEMFIGVEKVALKHGYMVMICNTDKSSTREIEYSKELMNRNVDGIIYNTYKKSKECLDHFTELSKSVPILFMDHSFEENSKISYVVSEGYESSKRAVKHLYEKGCRKISYIRLLPEISVIHHRYEGYKAGLRECGLTPDPKLVYQPAKDEATLSHFEVGKHAADYFLGLENPPDAVMGATDMLAIGAMKQMLRSGVAVPEQVKVIGFDNINLCEFVKPSLTTIAQPIYKIGEKAAEIMIAKLNGEKNIDDQIEFDSELIIREST